MTDTAWNPNMDEAPRDGTKIRVGWKFPEDAEMQESYVMKWDGNFQNALFPGVIGMWVDPNGNFTWSEHNPEGAPTHWKPLDPDPAPPQIKD